MSPARASVRLGARPLTTLLSCLLFAAPSIAQQTFDVPEAAGKAYNRCAEDNLTPDEVLKRCLEAARFELPARVAARVQIIIGWSYWALERPEPAAAAWVEALRLEPAEQSLALGLGLMLHSLGRESEARERFKQAIKLGADAAAIDSHHELLWNWYRQTSWAPMGIAAEQLALAHQDLGDAKKADAAFRVAIHYYSQSGERDLLAECWRKLLRLAPSADGYRDLAQWILEERRDPDAAIATHREAIRLAPDRADLHIGLARMLEAENLLEEAYAEYGEALRLDPKSEDARAGVKVLEDVGVARPADQEPPSAVSPDEVADLVRRCAAEGSRAACERALALDLSAPARAKVLVFLARQGSQGEQQSRDPETLLREAIGLAPDYAFAHYELGRMVGYSNPDEAIGAFQAAVRLRPDMLAAREALASVLINARRFPEAVAVLREAAARWPDDMAVLGDLGRAYGYASQWQEQVDALRRFLRRDPTSLDAWHSLVYALRQLGRNDEVHEAYRGALEGATGGAIGWMNVGSGLASLKDWEGAVLAYRKALESEESLRDDRIIESVRESGSSPTYYLDNQASLISALRKAGRDDEATRVADRAVAVYARGAEEYPDQPRFWTSLGEACVKLGRFERALDAYRRAVTLEPDSISGRLGVAVALIALDRRDEAARALDDAGNLGPSDPTMARTVAQHFEAIARPADALRWWSADETRACLFDGASYVTGMDTEPRTDHGSLATAYTALAAARPGDGVAEVVAASHLLRLDRRDEAEAAIRRAIAAEPDVAWTYARLGCFLGYQRPAEALDAFAAADRIDPAFAAKPFVKWCRDQAESAVKKQGGLP